MLFTLILYMFFAWTDGQGIQFSKRHVDNAIEQAAKEKKWIFIDTYAKWCKPCKQMDKVFRDKALGNFFNQHFISVKVDMDGPYGAVIRDRYEVIWLPTMIILDQHGNTRLKIDHLVNEKDLLRIATQTLRSDQAPMALKSLSSAPFESGTQTAPTDQPIITEETAPVIYVHDKRASSGRPHIMYHEAYLHLQLMDGKHPQVVRKYLSTQDDWSTEKNIRFIFDFVQDTRSKLFAYMIDNRARFNEIIGKEKVDETIGILVHQCLNNGIPRPTLEESFDLFSLIEPVTAEQNAYLHYLGRLLAEEKSDDFLHFAAQYLDDVNPYDHAVIYQYSSVRLKKPCDTDDLRVLTGMIDRAIVLAHGNAQYHLMRARLYFLQSEKQKAGDALGKAIVLARENGTDLKEFNSLQKKIAAL